jgi:hypothetical protein
MFNIGPIHLDLASALMHRGTFEHQLPGNIIIKMSENVAFGRFAISPHDSSAMVCKTF